MSFGILKTIIPCLEIENPECVSKSYGSFWQDLTKLNKARKKWSDKKNIVLIGLRGSGKSKIGQILNKLTGKKLIDIDKEIEKIEQKSIREMYVSHGWQHFRRREKSFVRKLAKVSGAIISTGGGTAIYKKNSAVLKKNGVLIYLHRKPQICAKVISEKDNRPPLTSAKNIYREMELLYKERDHVYREKADYILERSFDLKKDAKKIIYFLEK